MILARYPSNTVQRSNAGLMLGQRRKRWPSIKPALGERLVPQQHDTAIQGRIQNVQEEGA